MLYLTLPVFLDSSLFNLCSHYQSYLVCQYIHNYNLTYYCIIGSFRRNRERFSFLVLFLVATAGTYLLRVTWTQGVGGDRGGERISSRRRALSKLDEEHGMYVCIFVCIHVLCMYNIYLLFPVPTSPTAYILYVNMDFYIHLLITYINTYIVIYLSMRTSPSGSCRGKYEGTPVVGL